MGWLSLLVQGFRIASAITDLFKSILAQREFITKMDGINAEERVKLMLANRALEDDLRVLSDPVAFRARYESQVEAILKRVMGAKPGETVTDVFGAGTTTNGAPPSAP